MLKITQSTKKYTKDYRHNRKSVLLFIDGERPLNNGGNPIDDIIWRRTHDQPLSNETVKKLLTEMAFEEFPQTVVSVKYDRKAGCTMCPCSPGYVITIKEPYSGQKHAYWAEFTKDSVALMAPGS